MPRRQRNIKMGRTIGRLVNWFVILLVLKLRAPRADSVWLFSCVDVILGFSHRG